MNWLAQIFRGCTGPVIDLDPKDELTGKAFCTINDLMRLVFDAIEVFVILATIAFTFFVIYGAFMIMTSAGNTAKLGKGREAITVAIVGLVVIMAAWILINSVVWILGLKVGSTGLPCPWYQITC